MQKFEQQVFVATVKRNTDEPFHRFLRSSVSRPNAQSLQQTFSQTQDIIQFFPPNHQIDFPPPSQKLLRADQMIEMGHRFYSESSSSANAQNFMSQNTSQHPFTQNQKPDHPFTQAFFKHTILPSKNPNIYSQKKLLSNSVNLKRPSSSTELLQKMQENAVGETDDLEEKQNEKSYIKERRLSKSSHETIDEYEPEISVSLQQRYELSSKPESTKSRRNKINLGSATIAVDYSIPSEHIGAKIVASRSMSSSNRNSFKPPLPKKQDFTSEQDHPVKQNKSLTLKQPQKTTYQQNQQHYPQQQQQLNLIQSRKRIKRGTQARQLREGQLNYLDEDYDQQLKNQFIENLKVLHVSRLIGINEISPSREKRAHSTVDIKSGRDTHKSLEAARKQINQVNEQENNKNQNIPKDNKQYPLYISRLTRYQTKRKPIICLNERRDLKTAEGKSRKDISSLKENIEAVDARQVYRELLERNSLVLYDKSSLEQQDSYKEQQSYETNKFRRINSNPNTQKNYFSEQFRMTSNNYFLDR